MWPKFCPVNSPIMCRRLCFAEVKCEAESVTEGWLHQGSTASAGPECLTWAAGPEWPPQSAGKQDHRRLWNSSHGSHPKPTFVNGIRIFEKNQSNISQLAHSETLPVLAGLRTCSWCCTQHCLFCQSVNQKHEADARAQTLWCLKNGSEINELTLLEHLV